VDEQGATVISGKILSSIVKNLPDTAVHCEMADSARVLELRCGKSRYRLNTLSASDFPEFPTIELTRSIELPSELLSDMVDRVYRVTSRDSSRPILQGVRLSVEENTIRLVATDSYRLAVCD
jgi:DNA polymerase-3 subunit beta